MTVEGATVGEINPTGQGLLALVGITHTDDAALAAKMAEKLWRLRILDDEAAAADVDAPILVVSQFTLYANTVKGRRPSWNAAAPRPVAEPLIAQALVLLILALPWLWRRRPGSRSKPIKNQG